MSEIETNTLKAKAMLVRLTTKKMNRNRQDKELSSGVVERQMAKDGSLRVQKSLFSKAAVKEYEQTITEARRYFYRVTLPWDARGFYLLPVDIYKEFTKRMKEFTNQFRGQVNGFLESIDQHLAEAREMLGKAYKPEDYKFLRADGTVDRDYLLAQFDLSVEYSTLPETDDIRLTLSDEDKAALAEDIEAKMVSKFDASQRHIITILHEHILAIHERLSVDEHVFRDTLIGNLEDLCDLIPKLNISNDPVINRLAAEAKAKLTSWDPDSLRKDVKVRKQVARDADAILDKMQGIV